ncbi:DUF1553 domain-containing protein [Rhodopirellula sp. MGV]|uniref:DUF1553 domain-containing protein n=1 Tax=Rhodopirellula sp. MGV TaxID=2023130 RepID=UPI0018E9CE37|nr:DUF1553 domain-containing protein [Rhodopirellula sp. MGV]
MSADEDLSFNRDVRPILSQHCYACHGPDEHSREADLRLDDRDAAVDYGAITPGDTESSLLVERILTDDPDLIMPPPRGGKELSVDQKRLLQRWIEQGADYQQHWAFVPVPETVAVRDQADDWAINPIDRFVAQTHQRMSLGHQPEADRATWLRRVTFDLTGLPPTLYELDQFLADDSADAYSKVVDQLLASNAYGERMANVWLDVARYADTFGYQNDMPMEIWPWRDWVINAFNDNMPYDEFLTEQIAGDLLPNASQDQQLATAFNRLHRQTNEGGSVAEEFRLTGIADRTTTAGTAFLGLTFECCRCHDHKFDPIKQRDFYRLSAYFSDIDEFGLYSHFTRAQPSPTMLLYQGDQRGKHQQALNAIANARHKLDQAIESLTASWSKRLGELPRDLPTPRQPTFRMELDGEAEGVVGNASRCDGDQAIECEGAPEFGRTGRFTYSLWVRPAVQQPRMIVLHQSVAAEDAGFRGLQLTLDDGHPEFSMIHFWPGNAVRIESVNAIPTDRWTHLAVTHDGSGQASGLRLFIDGKLAEVSIERDKLTRDIRHRGEWGDANVGSVKLALGARFRDIGFRDGLIDDLQVFDTELSLADIAAIYFDAIPDDVRHNKDVQLTDVQALDHCLKTAEPSLDALREELQHARTHENELVTKIRNIMVMKHSDDAAAIHVLNRGEYTEKGEAVTAGVPEFLNQVAIDNHLGNCDDRLTLAKWMTAPDNPLTSRVMVNRMWHLFFGRGLVVTLEDFGAQGTPPSHPELLDYLARSLMDSGWDLHTLCREIVLSATYRQSSQITDRELWAADPNNVYLTHGPKHRLSAEQLRDAVLSASGLLVRQVGGPSVMPYQPAGLWQEAGTGKSYQQSTGDGLYRRSLYTFWKRTAPPPSMLTFDATSRETCTARRELTTTPLQALVFLNDPQYVEASRVLAEKLIRKHPSPSDPKRTQRWDELFRRLISRVPTDAERDVIEGLYHEQLSHFTQHPENAKQLLAVGEQPLASDLAADDAAQADFAATTIVVQTVIAYDETVMLR